MGIKKEVRIEAGHIVFGRNAQTKRARLSVLLDESLESSTLARAYSVSVPTMTKWRAKARQLFREQQCNQPQPT